MKNLILLILAIVIITNCDLTAQVSINTDGTSPNSSAMLDIKSSSKGLLPPRMTHAEMFDIPSPATGLMVFNTTYNKPAYFNGSFWKFFEGSMAVHIGDFLMGGVVFWLDGSGGGLVCAPTDQSAGAEWGCDGTGIPGADGIAIGTGVQNTIDIEAACTTSGIAADICANLSLNDYTDWFLPSKDELNAMYLNKAAIDSSALANGGGAFVSEYYWSSSEYDNDNAGEQNFNTGSQHWNLRNFTDGIRAIRAF